MWTGEIAASYAYFVDMQAAEELKNYTNISPLRRDVNVARWNSRTFSQVVDYIFSARSDLVPSRGNIGDALTTANMIMRLAEHLAMAGLCLVMFEYDSRDARYQWRRLKYPVQPQPLAYPRFYSPTIPVRGSVVDFVPQDYQPSQLMNPHWHHAAVVWAAQKPVNVMDHKSMRGFLPYNVNTLFLYPLTMQRYTDPLQNTPVSVDIPADDATLQATNGMLVVAFPAAHAHVLGRADVLNYAIAAASDQNQWVWVSQLVGTSRHPLALFNSPTIDIGLFAELNFTVLTAYVAYACTICGLPLGLYGAGADEGLDTEENTPGYPTPRLRRMVHTVIESGTMPKNAHPLAQMSIALLYAFLLRANTTIGPYEDYEAPDAAPTEKWVPYDGAPVDVEMATFLRAYRMTLASVLTQWFACVLPLVNANGTDFVPEQDVGYPRSYRSDAPEQWRIHRSAMVDRRMDWFKDYLQEMYPFMWLDQWDADRSTLRMEDVMYMVRNDSHLLWTVAKHYAYRAYGYRELHDEIRGIAIAANQPVPYDAFQNIPHIHIPDAAGHDGHDGHDILIDPEHLMRARAQLYQRFVGVRSFVAHSAWL